MAMATAMSGVFDAVAWSASAVTLEVLGGMFTCSPGPTNLSFTWPSSITSPGRSVTWAYDSPLTISPLADCMSTTRHSPLSSRTTLQWVRERDR